MYHYDAFISYNHNPRDIKVTRDLQRKLENYRLPEGLETSSGKKKIERVFLDSGELEAAGDLSKVLQDALDNADDLIVICSPESKASIWVRREIEYFLQSHPIDKIHTVLTEGEPIDVLPEILLSEEKEDEDGNIVSIPREPLSCDYRMPLIKANRLELPRLVAAIVGCRYDDLVQRQRQYRMKRQIAILASAAILLTTAIGYLVWSNLKIKENLNNTLREESLNLAIQSEQALANGDRIGAIRFALEALPSEEQDRPVVPRAVMALSNALDLYKTPDAEIWNAVRQYESKGKYIMTMCSSVVSDRTFLALLFTNGRVSLWDADTGTEIMADYTDALDDIRNVAFTDDGRLVMLDRENIYVVDPSEEKELKRIESGGEYELPYRYSNSTMQCDDLAIAGSSLWITIMHNDDETWETIYEIARVDLDSGKIERECRIDGYPDFVRISSDGKHLAYVDTGFELDDEEGYIYGPDTLLVIDTGDEAGAENAETFEMPYITGLEFYDDTRLMVSSLDERPEDDDLSQYGSVDYVGTGRRTHYSIAAEKTIRLSMINTESGSQVWGNEFSVFGSGSGTLLIEDNKDAAWDIIYLLGDNAVLFDEKGTMLASIPMSSNIIALFNKENMIRAVHFNGELSSYDISTGELATVHNLVIDPVSMTHVCNNESLFVASLDMTGMSQAETVTQYKVTGSDEAWIAYEYGEDTEVNGLGYERAEAIEAASDGRFVEIRYDWGDGRDDSEIQILVRDSEDGKILLNKVISTKSEEDYYEGCRLEYSGISAAGDKVYFADDHAESEMKLLSIDLEDGSEELIDVKPVNNGYIDVLTTDYNDVLGIGEYSIDEDHIHYLIRYMDYPGCSEYGDLIVVSVDPETGETEKHKIRPLTEDEEFGYVSFAINGACERVLCIEPSEDGGRKAVCYDFDGNIAWENGSAPESIMGIMITDEGGAVILEDQQGKGVLHFYSDKDGSETATAEIDGVSLGKSKLTMSRVSDDEYLLTAGNEAFLLDAETLEVRTVLSEVYLAYDPVNKIFMLGDKYRQETGHVPYRSLDEMIEMGRAYLPEEGE